LKEKTSNKIKELDQKIRILSPSPPTLKLSRYLVRDHLGIPQIFLK
jgi:hypothetical protein